MRNINISIHMKFHDFQHIFILNYFQLRSTISSACLLCSSRTQKLISLVDCCVCTQICIMHFLWCAKLFTSFRDIFIRKWSWPDTLVFKIRVCVASKQQRNTIKLSKEFQIARSFSHVTRRVGAIKYTKYKCCTNLLIFFNQCEKEVDTRTHVRDRQNIMANFRWWCPKKDGHFSGL